MSSSIGFIDTPASNYTKQPFVRTAVFCLPECFPQGSTGVRRRVDVWLAGDLTSSPMLSFVFAK